MKILYEVVGDEPWQTADDTIEPGDTFLAELDPDTEDSALTRGVLAIVPATYLVVGESVVHDTPPGKTFTRALRPGVEGLLLAGGHIVRVAPDNPEPEVTEPDDAAY